MQMLTNEHKILHVIMSTHPSMIAREVMDDINNDGAGSRSFICVKHSITNTHPGEKQPTNVKGNNSKFPPRG